MTAELKIHNGNDILTEDKVLDQAQKSADREEWKDAVACLREYQKTQELSDDALVKLAEYCSRSGYYDEAIAIYQRICQQRPHNAISHYCLGYQYQQKEQWAEAISAYKMASDLSPNYLKITLRLASAYNENGQPREALDTYEKGIEICNQFTEDRREKYASFYATFCAEAARIILSDPDLRSDQYEEMIALCQKSIQADPDNDVNFYHLGCALLEAGYPDDALEYLRKARALTSGKEYIDHKIAQAYMSKGNPDEALSAYKQIPEHRRAPYILNGMAKCHRDMHNPMEAAKALHLAIQREPRKFYHYWEFALALIALEAKDQAIDALKQANKLFRKERGEDYHKAIAKLEKIKESLQDGKTISFEEMHPNELAISSGKVKMYNEQRGFGFIEDDREGIDAFFHITRVKGRTQPQSGTRVKYVRERGEKGFQAAKVWLLEK